MIENLLILIFSLFLVVKGATLATKYSAKLAENFHVSRYIIGFVVVAFISILPEMIISINSALKGIPEFGLGTLFGSNVADLSLVFTILIFYAGRGIKIKSKVLKNIRIYPLFLLIPLIFGLNGHFSRIEGLILIVSGVIFYYLIFRNGSKPAKVFSKERKRYKNVFFLLFAMALLLTGSHFTVISATALAQALRINPILIGMFVVSFGTIMPELFYSLKAVKKGDDELAIGDIMGSVLADATIVVGIIALISPFYFPVKIIYVTGIFMVTASVILLKFMHSNRIITKKEGVVMAVFWLAYVIIELFISK